MPWAKTDVSKERVKFILEWERRWREGEGDVNLSELCRVFGIQRQTGHKWVKRYVEGRRTLEALQEHSRRPKTSPTAVPLAVQDLVVAARKLHPKWGPRKLRAWLMRGHPDVPLPSASCIAEILRRRGLTAIRRRRQRARAVPTAQPFAEATAPNATWCVDFKGWFRTVDGRKCYPLTITDAYSRFLIRCEGLTEPNGVEVERIFDSAFSEFGLPTALRSDNGPPFASTGLGGLTTLNVWWLQLGIRLERIQPGKPHQNGRHERMHLSLNEAIDPPAAHLRAQQRHFDRWRKEYNEDRPHEALGQQPPLSAYEPSTRHYPRPLLRPDLFDADWVGRLDKDGFLRWRRHRLFVTTALAHETVELSPEDDGHRWAISWGPILLGFIDTRRLDRGVLRPGRRHRPSTMSLD